MQEDIVELMKAGRFSDPHQTLGLQGGRIRLWRPDLSKCTLEVHGKEVEAKRIHPAGLFEFESETEVSPTDYRVFHPNGGLVHDPYAFGRSLGELDVHLASRGLHYCLHEVLGSTFRERNGIRGVQFGVWAPNALSVSLVGDFNGKDVRLHPMRLIPETGIWELFVPGLNEGESYFYSILTKDLKRFEKSDPVGHFFEVRPRKGSLTYDLNGFAWGDEEWMANRKKEGAIAIYEVHPGSWKRKGGDFLTYRELGHELASYCKRMGYTHVELMGICEHPLDESWGYQVTGYFAPTSRFGTPKEFQAMVDILHRAGIGVILDWVPAHFPTDPHALADFDGTCLFEHIDPRQGFHPEWSTKIFNYGRWEVSNFLIASALFWLKQMHVDGLRVDAVSSMLHLDYARKEGEWIPNEQGTNINLEAVEFIKHLNSVVKREVPEALMIAEEATWFPKVTGDLEDGGLGFDLKWNLGWMNDTLSFFTGERDLSKIAHVFDYAHDEKFVLVLSHDEVAHEKESLLSKMPKDRWANLRQLLVFTYTTPGKKLLFMGGDMGQESEWDCMGELPWEGRSEQLQAMVARLNELYIKDPSEGCSFAMEPDHENLILSYTLGPKLIVHHFGENPLENPSFPKKGTLIFDSDGLEWGGSGIFERKGILPPTTTLIFE